MPIFVSRDAVALACKRHSRCRRCISHPRFPEGFIPVTRVCRVVDAEADRLWTTLSAFGAWGTWLERVSESHIEGHDASHVPVGAIRSVGPQDRPKVREVLVACDSSRRSLSYEVASEPKWSAPIRNYRATARIIGLTDCPEAVVEWTGDYDCDEGDEDAATELLTGLYRAFIGWLAAASK